MPNRIGVYFASHHGQTRVIAGAIGQRLANYGLDVTITDLEGDPMTRPGLHEFDTVLIGAPLYLRRYPSAVTRFIRSHRTELCRHQSTGFFSVSLTAFAGTHEAYIESLGPLREFLSDVAWTPTWIASFGGALSYRQYNPLTRWVVKRIAAHYHGSTDTSHDHDLTSWETVSQFADHVAQNVTSSPFRSSTIALPARSLDHAMPRCEERLTERVTVDASPDEVGAIIDEQWPSTSRGYVPIEHETHEVAGGFVGQFTKGEFSIHPVRDEAALIAFDEPGHSKVVTDVWFDDGGERGTVVRAESRIHSLGPDGPPWFGWYSLILSRGVRRYMRRMLHAIRGAVRKQHDASAR